jgi:hypothetical protein
MGHARVPPQFHFRTQTFQHRRRLLNLLEWNVRVWIPDAKKYGRAVQGARVIPGRTWWPD